MDEIVVRMCSAYLAADAQCTKIKRRQLASDP
eukprot:COSAG02_NODE_32148_length_521_cov_1.196682_1_plen_31_part_10